MAKFILDIGEDYNYDLIGICCHNEDYKLCWALNENQHLRLSKSEDPFIFSGKNGNIISSHSFYTWLDEVNMLDYYLIQNKDKSNGKYLLPELHQIDFLFIMKEAGAIDTKQLLKELKEIHCIITAIELNPEEINSSDRIIL